MTNELVILVGAAASIGFLHTLFGPDHYLPFIALAKAQRWSSTKTFMITFLCGCAHVIGSVILGLVGIILGLAVLSLEAIESFRGELAGWLLLAFGFTYFIWGIYRMIRNKSHEHPLREDSHIHTSKSTALTPYLLLIIFGLGPCEPLIPILMYPSAEGGMIDVVIVATFFGVATIGTMLCIVLASFYGLSKVPLHKLEKYYHALAGSVILLCGVAVNFLGL